MSTQPQVNKIPIVSSSLPPPAPFLSPAIFSPLSSLVFCSGSCGVDPKTGTILPMDQGDVKDRTKLALGSVETLLKEKGMGLGDVVSSTIYLSKYTDDFASFNEAYIEIFSSTGKPMPSRTCIGVSNLPAGTDVEITCTALIPGPHSIAKALTSTRAPAPAPFLSSAIHTPTLTFVSGSCGIRDGKWLTDADGYDIKDRTRQAMANALALLEEVGLGLKDVVAATVYLTDYTHSYKPVTQVWSQELFPSAHKPTRTCIGVAALPAGTDVEITLTASPTASTPLTLLNPPPSQDPAPLPFLTKSIALPPPTSLVFLSGTTAEDLSSSSPPPSSSSYTVADRTTASLSRIRSLLAQQAGNLGLEHIVSVTIYLTKYEQDFGPMNEAYMEAFREVRHAGFAMPSRTCVGLVDLPEGTDVEITVVAGARDQMV